MDILFLLIPLSLVLVGIIVWAVIWAVKSGQFDDLEGPAYRVILDDNDSPSQNTESTDKTPDAENETTRH